MTTTVKFGTLGRLTENDEGAADIFVAGNVKSAGYITRIVSWDKPGSSRQNVPTIRGYAIESWGEGDALSTLDGVEFESLKAAKDAVRKLFTGSK